MKKINLTVNGQKIEVSINLTLNDILLEYFTVSSEFIVQINSRINIFDFKKIRLEENDVIEVISYPNATISDALEKEFIRKNNI